MKKLSIYYRRFIKPEKYIRIYRRYIKPAIQKKRYRKISKLMIALVKYLLFKRPYALTVETGTVCNLDCPTCPTPRDVVVGLRKAKNMDLESFKTIINNAHKSFAGIQLYWTNEPLLNKDLVNMVRYCNELNLYTFISTNMMLMTENRFTELIDAGLDEVAVCIDGFSAETYEHFRRGAKFETVKKNIENICRVKNKRKSANPWIEIQYIVTKQNAEEITACKEWANKIGIDGFHIQKLCIVQHLQEVEKLREEYYTEKMWEESNSQADIKVCINPNWQACVLLDGQVTICCNDIRGAYSYGNLLVDSFERIAENGKCLETIRKAKKRQLGICKKC